MSAQTGENHVLCSVRVDRCIPVHDELRSGGKYRIRKTTTDGDSAEVVTIAGTMAGKIDGKIISVNHSGVSGVDVQSSTRLNFDESSSVRDGLINGACTINETGTLVNPKLQAARKRRIKEKRSFPRLFECVAMDHRRVLGPFDHVCGDVGLTFRHVELVRGGERRERQCARQRHENRQKPFAGRHPAGED